VKKGSLKKKVIKKRYSVTFHRYAPLCLPIRRLRCRRSLSVLGPPPPTTRKEGGCICPSRAHAHVAMCTAPPHCPETSSRGGPRRLALRRLLPFH
jgi:hypothetical protein